MSLRCKEEPPAEHSDDGNAMVMGEALDFLAKFSGTNFDTLVADSAAAEPDDATATMQNHFGREWQRLEDAADDDETECSGDEVKAEEDEEGKEAKLITVPPWRLIEVGARSSSGAADPRGSRCIPGAGSASRAADPSGWRSASRAADPRGRASASSNHLVEEKKDVAVASTGAAAAAAEEVPRSGSGSGSISVTTCRPESKPSAFNYGPGTGEHAFDENGKIQRFFDNGHLTCSMIVLRSRMRQCLKLVFPSFEFELLSFLLI